MGLLNQNHLTVLDHWKVFVFFLIISILYCKYTNWAISWTTEQRL